MHPAVYYYGVQGKHNRYLLLGMGQLITTAILNNHDGFFKKFTAVRGKVEVFLIANKSLVTLTLQNLHASRRIASVADMFSFLIDEYTLGKEVTPQSMLEKLGVGGTVWELSQAKASKDFSEAAKSQTYVSKAIATALKCPQCGGLISPIHSLSYDHDTPVKDGGVGSVDNCELMHPYCNTAIKGGNPASEKSGNAPPSEDNFDIRGR